MPPRGEVQTLRRERPQGGGRRALGSLRRSVRLKARASSHPVARRERLRPTGHGLPPTPCGEPGAAWPRGQVSGRELMPVVTMMMSRCLHGCCGCERQPERCRRLRDQALQPDSATAHHPWVSRRVVVGGCPNWSEPPPPKFQRDAQLFVAHDHVMWGLGSSVLSLPH